MTLHLTPVTSFKDKDRKAIGEIFFLFLHHNINELKDVPGPRHLISLRHFQHSFLSQRTRRTVEHSEETNRWYLVWGSTGLWSSLCFNPPVFQVLPSPQLPEGELRKLEEMYFPLELNSDTSSPKDFPLLWMGEDRRLSQNTLS